MKTDHGNSTDGLAMLLSTDWFASSWTYVGVSVSPHAGSKLIADMRQIVLDMMGDAEEYWPVSHSPQRIKVTRDAFARAVEDAPLDAADKLLLKQLAGIEPGRPGHYFNRLNMALGNLARSEDSRGVLGEEPLRELRKFRARYNAEVPEFEALCLASTSEWDVKVCSWRPDIPTATADLAWEISMMACFVLPFWRWLERDAASLDQVKDACRSIREFDGTWIEFPDA